MRAPCAGTVVAVAHAPGGPVQAGEAVAVLEAMKMEHEVLAESDGVVRRVEVAVGDTVAEGEVLVVLVRGEGSAVLAPGEGEALAERDGQRPGAQGARDLDAPRADVGAVRERHALGLDAARPAGRGAPARAGPAHRAREPRRPRRRGHATWSTDRCSSPPRSAAAPARS